MNNSLRVIKVELGDRGYDIVIQNELIAQIGSMIASILTSRRCLVVTDRNVGPKYGHKLAKSLQLAGFDGSAMELPPGEGAKSLDVVKFMYDRCLEANLDRDSCLIALGGGVIGDLTGFVAATFYRGIPFVQAPTTLLAMVDAAIGGKTGVDHPQAKNAIGAFYQPRAVLIDPATLVTLPHRELQAGLAEVIKYGVIDDLELFAFVEQNADKLLAKDAEALAYVIERSAAIKARIVSQDERERSGGTRALLNFGHTFAHAIESSTSYQSYLHGEAVAIGMILAASLSVEQQLLSQADRDRIETLIVRMGLATNLKPGDPDTNTLYATMFKDKKVAQGKLRFVLLEKIGKAKVVTNIPEELVKKVWNVAQRG
ncbi:MAG: 3-dehydroquinate synthase [Planctomycetota bacterium]